MESVYQTQPGSSSTLGGDLTMDPSTENSRAVIFGIFLTLALCLLTQPVGSLLYLPAQGRFGALLFSIWRLNPIACFIEALVIAIALGRAACRVGSDGGPRRGIRRAWGHWMGGLHTTATAILFIRANKRGGLGFVIVKELIATRRRHEQELELLDDGDSTDVTGGEAQRVSDGEISTRHEATSSQSTPPTPEPGVIRRRTTRAEEDRAGQGQPTQQPNRGALPSTFIHITLRQALGSNALSHGEVFVDAVTIFSVIAIIIKLAATVLPWPVRVAAASMICGWVAVQLLLVLLHVKEIEDGEMDDVVDEAEKLLLTTSPSQRPFASTVALVALVSAPAVLYCCVVFFHFLQRTLGCGDSEAWSRYCVVILLVFQTLAAAISVLLLHSGDDGLHPLWLFLLLFYIFAMLLSAAASEHMWVWHVLYWPSCFQCLFSIVVFPTVEHDYSGHTSIVGSFVHVSATFLAFFLLLFYYDPSGTYKPEWLQWLG